MKISKQKLLIIALSFSLYLPLVSFSAGLIPCSGPSCSFDDVAKLINNIVNTFLSLSGGVATVTFVIAGAKMLMNPDNPGKRGEAVEMLKKTVIGMVLILGSWLIVHTLISFVSSDSNSALRFLGN